MSGSGFASGLVVGALVPSYVDSKPLIMREEGERWLRSRPAERPDSQRAAS